VERISWQNVLKFYQSQTDAGDSSAQFRLGEIYFHGEYGETNFVLAQKWFGIAATNGYPDATNFLNQLGRIIR
jgi:TPR repeat protein